MMSCDEQKLVAISLIEFKPGQNERSIETELRWKKTTVWPQINCNFNTNQMHDTTRNRTQINDHV